MGCDLGRLYFAIEAASEAERNRTNLQIKLAGFEIKQPPRDADTDEEFNDQMMSALNALGMKG